MLQLWLFDLDLTSRDLMLNLTSDVLFISPQITFTQRFKEHWFNLTKVTTHILDLSDFDEFGHQSIKNKSHYMNS